MSNEPKFSMKQLTSRVELEDYAKVIQLVDTKMDENGNPVYKDISCLVRDAIHTFVAPVELTEQSAEWIDVRKQENIERRQAKREKRRSMKARFVRLFRRVR